jgi:hypothetical protein
MKETNGILQLEWKRKKGKEADRYDGTYLLRTNRKDLTDEEIWRLYIMLTRAEKAFRHLKSDLGLTFELGCTECRPVQ